MSSDELNTSSPEGPSERTSAPTEGRSTRIPSTPGGRPPRTEVSDGRDYPRLGSVGFRRGTLTPGQQATWDENWDTFGRQLSDELLNVEEWFGRQAPTILEIGSGTGTSTAAMAPIEADHNVIAVEIYRPGLAKLLGAVVRGDLSNIRMIRGDGVEVLHRMIAPESLDAVRIFFPDPWPKARHHKRRIIQSGTLHLIASRLKPGGVLHVATDHAGYAEWIDELVNVEPELEYMGWPWPECPVLTDRQLTTKFETRGLTMDHTIREYLWRKRPTTEA